MAFSDESAAGLITIFPETSQKLSRRGVEDAVTRVAQTHPGESKNWSELRKAAAQVMRTEFGLDYDPDGEIIAIPDYTSGLTLACLGTYNGARFSAFAEQMDLHHYSGQLQAFGGKVVPLPRSEIVQFQKAAKGESPRWLVLGPSGPRNPQTIAHMMQDHPDMRVLQHHVLSGRQNKAPVPEWMDNRTVHVFGINAAAGLPVAPAAWIATADRKLIAQMQLRAHNMDPHTLHNEVSAWLYLTQRGERNAPESDAVVISRAEPFAAMTATL